MIMRTMPWIFVAYAYGFDGSSRLSSFTRSEQESESIDSTSRWLQRTEIPARPSGRFVPWSGLGDEERTAAVQLLGYAVDQWNVPGTIDLERIRYADLTPAQVEGVATAMGIEGDNAMDVYDCWISHYSTYAWTELASNHLQDWFLALEWTRASWEGRVGAPLTLGLPWSDLTLEQRQAAGYLCFDENIWNDVDLETIVVIKPTFPAVRTPSASPSYVSQPSSPIPTVQNAPKGPSLPMSEPAPRSDGGIGASFLQVSPFMVISLLFLAVI